MKFKAILHTSSGKFTLCQLENDESSFQLIGGREFICEAASIIEAELFFSELLANDSLWNACILNDENCKIEVIAA